MITVERPTVWLVVALMCEVRDGETFIVSEPKIVKIIQKETKLALSGKTANALLSGSTAKNTKISVPIASPYTSFFFSGTECLIASQHGPQPPTSSF